MQALAERLDDRFAGSTLERIVPIQFSALKTYDPAPESFFGTALASVGRRGKYLVADFGGPRILVHLSQGGRVDLEDAPKVTRPKGALARFVFRGAGTILLREYGTQRKAGWWTLSPGDEGPLAKLGPEPDSVEFRDLIEHGTDGRRIHTLLRDQRTVSGIGRGFSDDILHDALLSPYVTLAKLTSEERKRLLDSVERMLSAALESERRRTGGLPAKLPDRFTVHGRYGSPCPRCGAEMKRVSYESYEVTYCPACQTGGKVLADRRLSRLLK
ncbi:MAG: formamidopyrimidine-DNA glycosylase [Actinomycetota bacterium]|jgi:formamidopyrimidine-DNA glycosylase|nr:formamidopyrimidine-DNA glycosylase [Actinomycetota bacterium]